jgi:benzoate-CoA ligase family protein
MVSGREKNCIKISAPSASEDIEFSRIFNVADAFIDRHIREGRSNKRALLTQSVEVTYGELASRVAQCGNALRALDLKRGDRVLIVSVDCPEFFYVFWGAIKAGFVPVPINTQLKVSDYEHLMADSGCAAVFHNCPNSAEVCKAIELGAQRHVLNKETLLSLMGTASNQLDPAETGPADDCFWLYSSGSTGQPKGVVHAHKDMVVTSIRYGQGVLGIRSDDLVFCASKLFFSYGFGGGMTFPLWAGATVALSEELPSADMAFRMISAYRPSVYFGVPTLYANQLHVAEQHVCDLSSVRLAASAGEVLPAVIHKKWNERFGISILDGVGSTEVLHIFISNRVDKVKPGTSGYPVPGYEVKVVDADRNALGPNQVGLLLVKGQSNARCYWNSPEKTAATMCGEWLNTGDMYSYDEEGCFTSAGRADDMIKVGGMWCSPLEIEAALLTHPDVLEAAVVGQTDNDGLLKPAAYLVLKAGLEVSDAVRIELQQFCKSQLAGFKYPRWIYFLSELPKTVTGKIQRFRLRRANATSLSPSRSD